MKLEMYPDMPHIFPMLAPLGLEDARVAICRQAKFVSSVLQHGPENVMEPRPLKILVHDRRTQSFEDIQRSIDNRLRKGASNVTASTPHLAGLAKTCSGRERLREALSPPERA